MTESSNLNLDLHHQEDFHASSSSLVVPWNQDLVLNSSDFSNGALSGSRDFMRINSKMPTVQELGFQLPHQAGHGQGHMMMNHSSSQQSHYLPKNIKAELSETFSKLTGINLQDHSMMPSQAKHEYFNQILGLHEQTLVGDLGFDPVNLGSSNWRGSFSMVFPSANVSAGSSFQPLFPMRNSSGDVDLQALDLLASARFGRTILSQPPLNNMALLREDLTCGPLGQLREPSDAPTSKSYHKASYAVSGVTETKRTCSLDSRTTQPTPSKKPRSESRSLFTPFKVRKEKLGDRITALQQLVAPFGKTDTASVLMEAIGYIKFLQDQVETLSVPYMRPSKNNKTRTSQEASTEEGDEPKADLRSRGLCLVPLSCTSYVINENEGVWSPPSYR